MPSWFKEHPVFTFIGFLIVIIIAAVMIGEFTKKKFTSPERFSASNSASSQRLSSAAGVMMDPRFEKPEYADERSDAQSDAAMACSLHRSDKQLQAVQDRLDSTTAERRLQFTSGSNVYDELVTPE